MKAINERGEIAGLAIWKTVWTPHEYAPPPDPEKRDLEVDYEAQNVFNQALARTEGEIVGDRGNHFW